MAIKEFMANGHENINLGLLTSEKFEVADQNDLVPYVHIIHQ